MIAPIVARRGRLRERLAPARLLRAGEHDPAPGRALLLAGSSRSSPAADHRHLQRDIARPAPTSSNARAQAGPVLDERDPDRGAPPPRTGGRGAGHVPRAGRRRSPRSRSPSGTAGTSQGHHPDLAAVVRRPGSTRPVRPAPRCPRAARGSPRATAPARHLRERGRGGTASGRGRERPPDPLAPRIGDVAAATSPASIANAAGIGLQRRMVVAHVEIVAAARTIAAASAGVSTRCSSSTGASRARKNGRRSTP